MSMRDRGSPPEPKRTHRVPEQEQRQAAMLLAQRGTELGDVGDQPCESGRAEVTQPAVGGAPVPAMIDSVDQEPRCVQRLRKAVIAFAMLGESVGDLHHSSRCAGNVSPSVRHDLGTVCVGEKGGG
jgi:hypothetical protein